MNAFALAALFRVLLAVSEPSQTPPPTPAPESEIKQEDSASSTPSGNPAERPTFTPIESGKSAKRKGTDTDNKAATNWPLIFSGVIAFGAFAQIIAVIVQARFTRRGLRLTKESIDAAKTSLKHAQDTTRLDQRAWVATNGIRAVPPVEGQKFVVNVTVKNTGKTFARRLSVSCCTRSAPVEMELLDFAQEIADMEQGRDRSVALLAPGGTYDGGSTSELGIRKDIADDFRDGKTKVFIFGKITYWDVFECEHWTTYCSIFSAAGGLEVCREFNDADNNRA
jgi:hypothetical protein